MRDRLPPLFAAERDKDGERELSFAQHAWPAGNASRASPCEKNRISQLTRKHVVPTVNRSHGDARAARRSRSTPPPEFGPAARVCVLSWRSRVIHAQKPAGRKQGTPGYVPTLASLVRNSRKRCASCISPPGVSEMWHKEGCLCFLLRNSVASVEMPWGRFQRVHLRVHVLCGSFYTSV